MDKNVYIVLHDFTPVGDAALNYATYFGSQVISEIKVLHLVADKSEIMKAKAKLEKIIQNHKAPSNVQLTPLIRVGSIFDGISNVVAEQKSQLVIMGTHGMKGLQKIFGSHAMKLITNSNTPFIVVQEKTVPKPLKKIIVPIDLSKESLQIVNNAGDIARIFNAKAYICYEKQSDTILLNQLKNRIHIVKQKFDERSVETEFVQLDEGGAYYKKILSYSQANEMDMIAIAYYTESLLPQFEKYAQSLITNEFNTPCMIINSKATSFSYF